MAQFIKIASTTDLAPGEVKCVEVAGKKIALFNLDGTFFAIDDTCTHPRGAALGGRGVG
jgi:nitrite reductase/ring-hydroxylating ferredoxin subunit